MPEPIDPGPDQESVWDYPRPPALDEEDRRIRVIFNDTTIADTSGAIRVLETSHPPTYYLPPQDVAMESLRETDRTTMCEFKGRAVYFTVSVGTRRATTAAWSYPDPTPRYSRLTDYVAFYPSKMDRCLVGEEVARAQEGDFYGGWITDDIVGPFKGAPGTGGW